MAAGRHGAKAIAKSSILRTTTRQREGEGEWERAEERKRERRGRGRKREKEHTNWEWCGLLKTQNLSSLTYLHQQGHAS